MRTVIYYNKKYVSFWLTRLESNDEKVRASLEPIIQDYYSKGWKVVVFDSGTQNITVLTRSLLEHGGSTIGKGAIGYSDHGTLSGNTGKTSTI